MMVRLTLILIVGCLNSGFAQDARLILTSQASPDRTRHLFLDVQGPPATRVNQIIVKLPRDLDTSLIQKGFLPAGWVLRVSRHKITVSGPPLPLPFSGRLELGRQDPPLQVNAYVRGDGETIYQRENMLLKLLPPLQVRNKLRGLLVLPPLLASGDYVEMRLINPLLTPPQGSWIVAGQTLKAEAESENEWVLRMRVPELPPGPVAVKYIDPRGLCTVDVTNETHSRVVPPPKNLPSAPKLVRCAARAVLGGGLCVGGYFPEGTRAGLLINGRPTGPPITASNQALFVPVPLDLKPGVHKLSGDPAVGFAQVEPFEFELIDIQAELDKAELVEGQQAELSFFIVGSQAPMQIRVINTTPEIISLEGGDEQVIETNGGGGNIATRGVETRALGNFSIKYEIGGSRCPCTEQLDENNLIP